MIDLENYIPLKKMGIARFTALPEMDIIGYRFDRYVFYLDGIEIPDLGQFNIIFTYSHN